MSDDIDADLHGEGLFGEAQAPRASKVTATTKMPITLSPKASVPSSPDPFLAHHAERLGRAAFSRLAFDEATWDWASRTPVGLDVELYRNFFCACFRRFDNGKVYALEQSTRMPRLDLDALRRLMRGGTIITFNGLAYDIPILTMVASGRPLAEVKEASDRIVRDGLKPWQVEREYKVSVPRDLDHVDVMETNPAVRQSQKILGARLDQEWIVDLPFEPDATLTPHQMNVVTLYCLNDLEHLRAVWTALAEPIALRETIGREIGRDLRSKSDAQMGEEIIRRRVEAATGRSVGKPPPPPASVGYQPPPFASFSGDELRRIVDDLREATFPVGVDGHPEAPPTLKDLKATIGGSVYAMGVGGLHSQEEHRALRSDDENALIDVDVTGHYPNIIAKLGFCPPAVGPEFSAVYKNIITDRTDAKKRLGEIEKLVELRAERDQLKAKTDGLKISTNGVFGKFGSAHSFLYHPSGLLATTLTGQLTVLMLIERAEAAGIRAVSANTDGATFVCPRAKEPELSAILRAWEDETSFQAEVTRYRALFNSSVNSYVAIKEDGKVKVKGPLADPWSEGDLRGMMSKNPQMRVLTSAVVDYLRNGVRPEDTVAACADPRRFVTVVRVTGGAVWRGRRLGRVARWYWSTAGEPLTYAANGRKVAKTDGAAPMDRLTDAVPADLDRARYVAEAKRLIGEYGCPDFKGGLI